jgi:methionyl-tRNA synthetase
MGTYYVTTSIPYVNATPHLGFALELVQADVFARYHRLHGDDVRFLTGTDENSLTNVLAAEAEGVPVGELVDRNAEVFRGLPALLDASTDDFIRTARDERHRIGAARFWKACVASGDVYKRAYRGLYCVRCERFYAEDELVNGLCPVHEIELEVVEEENYFFRLSRYGPRLFELLDSGVLRVLPDWRHAEARAFVARGLADISISRTAERARGWGLPVPGDPSHVMYVWFDALTNYITALGYGAEGDGLYGRYWVENDRRVHTIGKDIVRFHAIYWPAMLLSAGEPLPSTVFVHGFLTRDGQRMSKTLGTGVDPRELVATWGVDAVRYWLLREVPPTGDGDFSDARFRATYDADLADDLGNLLNRTVSMVWRYFDGRVPDGLGELPAGDVELRRAANEVATVVPAALEAYDPRAALVTVWGLVGAANRFVDASAPWRAETAERRGAILAALVEALRVVAEGLRPLLPRTAEQIAAQLGGELSREDWVGALRWRPGPEGRQVARAEPIFPKG